MNFTLLGGLKGKVKKNISKIKKFFTKERIIALSMLGRILSLVLLLSLFPYNTVNTLAKDSIQESAQNNEITVSERLVLNVQKNVPLELKQLNKPEIILGESESGRIAREEAEKQAKLALENTSRVVYTREIERPAPIDPDLSVKRDLAKRAASVYGIDWKILEAVWQVESGKSWNTTVTSYAGAQGPMQFMPGTWAAYGQDGNGDGIKDVYNVEDALFGAANYLAASGAASGDNYRALFNYNHADWYVQKVLAVANSIID